MPKQKSGPKRDITRRGIFVPNTNTYCRICNQPMTRYWFNTGHQFTRRHQLNVAEERDKTSRALAARRKQ